MDSKRIKGWLSFSVALAAVMSCAPALALNDSHPMPTKKPLGQSCAGIQSAAAGAYEQEAAVIDGEKELQTERAESEKSCFAKYSDISVATQVGLPSAASIIKGILGAAEGMACQAVDEAVAKGQRMTGQNATLPGGAGYVKVGTFYKKGGGVQPTSTVDTGERVGGTAADSAGGGILNKIRNLFY